MTTTHSLAAEHLTLGYGDRTVIESLDLVVPPGRITVIVGANACGKSTLLRSMSRLLAPREGRVVLDGKEVHRLPAKQLARTLGLLPQSPVAPQGITVADLVGRGRHPHQSAFSRWKKEDDEAVASALAATRTTPLAEQAVDELSGGQGQRVWIAMALAQQTDLLLLDEPTTFLGASHQIEVLDLLTDLNETRGTTIVMVLHDLNLAARYADHLIALAAGRLHAFGSRRNVTREEPIPDLAGPLKAETADASDRHRHGATMAHPYDTSTSLAYAAVNRSSPRAARTAAVTRSTSPRSAGGSGAPSEARDRATVSSGRAASSGRPASCRAPASPSSAKACSPRTETRHGLTGEDASAPGQACDTP